MKLKNIVSNPKLGLFTALMVAAGSAMAEGDTSPYATAFTTTVNTDSTLTQVAVSVITFAATIFIINRVLRIIR